MPLTRARDLRANIKEMGFERGVVHTLELALEQQSEMHGHIRQMSELITTCIEQVEKMVVVGDHMRQTVDQLRRDLKGNDDADPGGFPSS